MKRREFVQKTGMAAITIGMFHPSVKGQGLRIASSSDRKINVFSKHLQWLDYSEMAKVAADIGFDGVDITARPNGHVLPENVETDLPRVVDAVRNQGLLADTITTGFNNVSDPYAEKTIKTAAGIGIKQYRMSWIKYDNSIGIDENLKKIIHQLSQLAEMNRHYGIRGDYQNHAGSSFGASVWDLWHVLKEVDSEWLGCRYDIRHATVEGTQSWVNGLMAIAPYIRSLDIKDFTWGTGERPKPVNVPLGTGIVDFSRYASLLSEQEIQGNMTMHFEYPLGGAERGRYELSISPAIIVSAMKKDLAFLKGLL